MTLNFGQQNLLLDNGQFNQMITRLLVKYALGVLIAEQMNPGSQPASKVEIAAAVEKNSFQYAPRVINFVGLASDEIFKDLTTADQVVSGMQDDSLLPRIYKLFDASWGVFAEKTPQPQPQPQQPSSAPGGTTSTTPTTTVKASTPTPVLSTTGQN